MSPLNVTSFLVSLVLLSAASNCDGQTKSNQLAGDKAAIEMVDRMLESIGGKKAWREARSIKVELIGYYAQEENPWKEVFWLDLDTARGRFIIKSETKDEVIAWTPESGWHMTDGVVEAQDSARHHLEMEYWKRQAIVVFHRLATGLPKTRVELREDENIIKVLEAGTDDVVAEFRVNKKGEPVQWGTTIGDNEMEHVFGPLKNFENLSFPVWGATASGVWRYTHSAISLSTSPPLVSYDPPRRD